MATTGFWPVRSSLGAVIRYADNPDKTTNPKYLDDDLAQVLRYAENDDKTDRRLFVTGIHCTAEHALEDMTAVQRRFGLKGQIVAYHGYQSFKTGEVTPEEAHRIGIETAKEMWGDRFQVLVTTHLNTQTVHNHMVVNAVSYRDGKKFQNHISDHIHLREISDRICRERQLSVLEDAPFFGGKSRGAYWAERSGKLTHRAMLKRDIEDSLRYAMNFDGVIAQLRGKRYEYDWRRGTVKVPDWERGIRLDRLDAACRLIVKNDIHTPEDLSQFITKTEAKIKELERERHLCRNRLRRPKPKEVEEETKRKIAADRPPVGGHDR